MKLDRFFFVSIVIIFFGCQSGDSPSPPMYSDPLLVELSQMTGKYLWNPELKRFVYSEKMQIENILSRRNPDELVVVLADCLDDKKPSRSTLGDATVVMGIICYEALSQTAYYEHILPNGDIAPEWAGHMEPNANTSQLEAAKKAWQLVINAKTYKLL
ncbi:MAG: hypothetical protein OEZ43_07510 [Gammaproteobacteria bacterium]|nr:hypothetical protein [Gammaproteobacteria bacterium]